jgi:dihydroorotate dehydrogenase (NAD+) catalytic subunit
MGVVDVTANLGSLSLKNPVMPASGTFGCGSEMDEIIPRSELGALVTKSVTLEPKPGNPGPRLFETACGLLNSVGLPSPGIDAFVRDELPFLREAGTALIVSIAGERACDYTRIAARLSEEPGISALELDLSCPNVDRGLWFSSDPGLLGEVVAAVRGVTALPVIAKLSPNVADIAQMARAAQEAGADAVSAVNTFSGLAIDIRSRMPVFPRGPGGLSGPAVKPLALKAVWDIFRGASLPIIGMEGIVSARDALEFILAGASAVAIGTGNFVNPRVMLEVIGGIREYMEGSGLESLGQMVGAAHRLPGPGANS